MTIQSFDFPPPENEADFESFCLAIFREQLQAPDLQKYARRGQAQHGVDIVGHAQNGQLCGIQCKLRNADQALLQSDVTKEVEKAKEFSPPLDKFLIATTARRDPGIQKLAVEITKSHLEQHLFSVHVYSWDDLKEIIKRSTQLARNLYGVGADASLVTDQAMIRVAAGPVLDLRQVTSDFHREIDEAFEFIGQGKPEVTVELLERLKRRRWDQLSGRERYRLLANVGNAWLTRQDNERAAKAYLEASTHDPSDENARAFEALAYLLLGETERAFDLANALCRDHPMLSRAHMIRIRCSPPVTPFDELLESLPAVVRVEHEVVLALHDRALGEGRYEDAERIIRNYARKDHGWAQLTVALGTTVLERELKAMHVSLDGPILSDATRVSEAAELMTKGLEQIPEGDPEHLSLGVYLNRGMCFRLLGEVDRARADFRNAQRLAPADERVALAIAFSAYPDKGNLDEAIGILDEYLQQHESQLVEIQLAKYLQQRKTPSDLENAVNILESLVPNLAAIEEGSLADFLEVLADLYNLLGRGEEALTLVEGLGEKLLPPVSQRRIHSDVLRRLGRTDEALDEANLALKETDELSDRREVQKLAFLFEHLESYTDAFPLWQRLVSLDSVTAETHHFLRCAKAAGEDELVMDFCRELRSRGHCDQQSIYHETTTLLQYSEYQKAKEAFLQYLEVKPDDKLVRLHLTTVALQQGWDELVSNDPSELPTLEELQDAEIGASVVNVLRLGPNPTLAVDFAYNLCRRFPDSASAHAALVFSVLQPGDARLSIPAKLSKVEPGTAVRWIDCETGESHWLVIEDASDASMMRCEYKSDHSMVQAMLNREVGDEFSLSEVGFRDRRGRIEEIRDKRIFRAQESMAEWTQRFPDQPLIEVVPVRIRADGPSSLEDFREVIEIAKRTSESQERIDGVYREGNIPIAALAQVNGKPVFETVAYLAANQKLRVRACRGVPRDFDEVKLVLDETSSIVLGPTAIATLELLGETAILRDIPFRCIVTESTLRELRRAVGVGSPFRRVRGFMGFRNGRPVYQEVRDQDMVARVKRIEELIALLEARCEVVGGREMARLEVNKRHLLMDLLSQPSVESAAAANFRGFPIWTDDHLLLSLLKEDLPSPHVWTQSVFLWAQNIGIIERERHSQAAARLLLYGYDFTRLNSGTVLDTCKASGWRTDHKELLAVLSEFGNTAWDSQVAVRATFSTVQSVWREAELVEQAHAVTTRILASLLTREDGLAIVALLYENVDQLMGLNVLRADSLKDLLHTLLEAGGAPIQCALPWSATP